MMKLTNALFTLLLLGASASVSAQTLEAINASGFTALPVNTTISVPGPFIVEANTSETEIFSTVVHGGNGYPAYNLSCSFEHDSSADRRKATNGVHLMVAKANGYEIEGKGFPTAITAIKCNRTEVTVGQLIEGLNSVHGSLTLPPNTEMQ